MGIKGYKAFNKDMTCKGFQYEENKEYEMEEEPKCCGNGFHFCENPLDTLNYYDLCNSTFAEVEAIGDINKPDEKDKEDSKIATNKIKIGAKLDLTGFIKASVDFLWEKCKIKDKKQDEDVKISSGYNSKLASSGYYSNISHDDRLKQLLKSEQYICIKENNKPFAYRFIFPRIMKTMPIRNYRVEEYKEWIKE